MWPGLEFPIGRCRTAFAKFDSCVCAAKPAKSPRMIGPDYTGARNSGRSIEKDRWCSVGWIMPPDRGHQQNLLVFIAAGVVIAAGNAR